MKVICYSLLKTIEEYDEELSALQRPPGGAKNIINFFLN